MAIGFIGLGGMGQAITLNLLRAGHGMTGWNRSPGATVAARAEEVGKADIVFSMLADDHAARAVIPDGRVLDAMRPGAVLVNLATVSVAFAREMAGHRGDRRVGYVAAPVLGRRVLLADAGQEVADGLTAPIGTGLALLPTGPTTTWNTSS